jgi:predicted nuclease of predicted toxin-antitoxin system
MKLLFDQNLSPKLVQRLADLFPASSHVQTEGLACANDDQIWEHARLNGLTIVTKDAHFNNLSVMQRQPAEGNLVAAWELHDYPGGGSVSCPPRRY